MERTPHMVAPPVGSFSRDLATSRASHVARALARDERFTLESGRVGPDELIVIKLLKK